MGSIDSKLSKWISRKLLVFAIATIALFAGKLDSSDWAYLAIAYIAIQGMIDAKSVIQNFKKNE